MGKKARDRQVGIDRRAGGQRLDWLVVGAILALTAGVYWQVGGHEFVQYDDQVYVLDNIPVRSGLTGEGIAWAFTSGYGSNWHPLTWISHMVDCELFGLAAGSHHYVSLFWHLAGTLMLFGVFRGMTGALWPSAFVAAGFALHPLHVESVAWAAERKDVLSAFFWAATMGAYVFYTRRGGIGRYGLMLACYACGLMAKPMLVSLPLILLLLDYWPLGRFARWPAISNGKVQVGQALPTRFLLVEKLPLVGLALVSSLVTFWVQQGGGAVKTTGAIGLPVRLSNALVSYADYMGKMFWPSDLAVFYPHPRELALGTAAGAGLLLAAVTVLAVVAARRYRYLLVGWLWYVISLTPVIGLVQVGDQARADRYTYIPLTGLLVMIAWGGMDLVGQRRHGNLIMGAAMAVMAGVLSVCTFLQVGHWRNSMTLFERALAVTENNYVAHCGRGNGLLEEERFDEAIVEFQALLRINPNYHEVYKVHDSLGRALLIRGRVEEGIEQITRAHELEPSARSHFALGNALIQADEIDAAIAHYREAVGLKPDYGLAHSNLGAAYTRKQQYTQAVVHYRRALAIDPDYIDAHQNFAVTLTRMGQVDEAMIHYREVLRLNLDHAGARGGLEALEKRR